MVVPFASVEVVSYCEAPSSLYRLQNLLLWAGAVAAISVLVAVVPWPGCPVTIASKREMADGVSGLILLAGLTYWVVSQVRNRKTGSRMTASKGVLSRVRVAGRGVIVARDEPRQRFFEPVVACGLLVQRVDTRRDAIAGIVGASFVAAYLGIGLITGVQVFPLSGLASGCCGLCFGVLLSGTAQPVYLRIRPGLIELLRSQPAGQGINVVRSVDLRNAAVTLDLYRHVVLIGSGRTVTELSTRFVRRRRECEQAIIWAALWDKPIPGPIEDTLSD